MAPPPTLLYPVLSHLPQLRELRLKSIRAEMIPRILQNLPNLHTLDTEYLLSNTFHPPAAPTVHFPALKNLTVRTSSVDTTGPKGLWNWILDILPHPGLETFTLNMFTVSGHAVVPGSFIMDMAARQGDTLLEFSVGDAVLGLEELEGLCIDVKGLEKIKGKVICKDTTEITKAIESAKNLRVLQMQVQWLSSCKVEPDVILPKIDTKSKARLAIMPAYDPINTLADRSTADVKDETKTIPRRKSAHFYPSHVQTRTYAIPGGRFSPPRSAHPHSYPYTLPSIKYLKLDANLEPPRRHERYQTDIFYKSPGSPYPPSLTTSAVSPETPTWDVSPQTPGWETRPINQWDCSQRATEIETSAVVAVISPAADVVYPTWGTPRTPKWAVKPRFGKRDAREMMLRFKGSKLREVAVWPHRYVGRWVLAKNQKPKSEDDEMDVSEDDGNWKMPVKEEQLRFVVKEEPTQEKWHT
ncbi:hypothetical protein BDQ17DRAFT_1344458 [Cyathus striatus]|nr:hypothetical protein BDQ17DRAFT_1344458 [Cyathus striatus]